MPKADIGAAFIMALDHHSITAPNGGTALIAATHAVRRPRLSRTVSRFRSYGPIDDG
jgi:hypothetical protein